MTYKLSVEESAALLKDNNIDLHNEAIRRSLYYGLLQEKPPELSKLNWDIPDCELLKLMNSVLQEQNEQLKLEIAELKKKNCILWKENHELRISIGIR